MSNSGLNSMSDLPIFSPTLLVVLSVIQQSMFDVRLVVLISKLFLFKKKKKQSTKRNVYTTSWHSTEFGKSQNCLWQRDSVNSQGQTKQYAQEMKLISKNIT